MHIKKTRFNIQERTYKYYKRIKEYRNYNVDEFYLLSCIKYFERKLELFIVYSLHIDKVSFAFLDWQIAYNLLKNKTNRKAKLFSHIQKKKITFKCPLFTNSLFWYIRFKHITIPSV